MSMKRKVFPGHFVFRLFVLSTSLVSNWAWSWQKFPSWKASFRVKIVSVPRSSGHPSLLGPIHRIITSSRHHDIPCLLSTQYHAHLYPSRLRSHGSPASGWRESSLILISNCTLTRKRRLRSKHSRLTSHREGSYFEFWALQLKKIREFQDKLFSIQEGSAASSSTTGQEKPQPALKETLHQYSKDFELL